MRRDAVRVNQWPRYAAAIAAFFWALGMAAGCHVPQAATATMHMATVSTLSRTAIGHEIGALAERVPLGAGSCAPMDHECKHLAQACPASDLVALAVVLAILALAGSAVWWVVSIPRGPPPRFGLIPHRPGRVILTRHCIARI